MWEDLTSVPATDLQLTLAATEAAMQKMLDQYRQDSDPNKSLPPEFHTASSEHALLVDELLFRGILRGNPRPRY